MNSLADTQLSERVAQIRPVGLLVCIALEMEYRKLGFTDAQGMRPDFDALVFVLKRDPFSGQASVEGSWMGHHRQRIGSLVFHADGSFFAEYDVIKPHPEKSKWFVEAVTAWGQGCKVKTEARLIAAV